MNNIHSKKSSGGKMGRHYGAHYKPSLFSQYDSRDDYDTEDQEGDTLVDLYYNVQVTTQPKATTLPVKKGRLRLLAFLAIVFRWYYIEVFMQEVADETLSSSSNIHTKYEVVTTNYGWNSPAASNFSRRIVTGEFFNATKSHYMYNSSAWADLEQHPDPKRQIIAFMDIDTCLELNYPNYGGREWWRNVEVEYMVKEGFSSVVTKSCEHLKKAATSPALLANPDSRLILLDCSGARRHYLKEVCIFNNDQVIISYLSVKETEVRSSIDVGLPPPALKPINLPAYERYELETCQKRKYLFSFQGREVRGSGREGLHQFSNYTDMHIRFHEQKNYIKDIQQSGQLSNDYATISICWCPQR